MNTSKLLTDYFCKMNGIDPNMDFHIEYINARELLVPDRIDLVAKLKYIESRDKGLNLTYAKQLYSSHIEAFSEGTFAEPGSEFKVSLEQYFLQFDILIDSIKKHGVDSRKSAVPVGDRNIILDGSHRTAIAIYFNFEIPIIRFNHLSVKYDIDFFRNRLLSEQYLEFLAQEYCKLKCNVYFACLWPKAKLLEDDHRSITELLDHKGIQCVYHREIKLTFKGIHNLITQVYSHQNWIGNIEDSFLGALDKANACFDENGSINIYLLECDGLPKILDFKSNVREKFGLGNHSIHITDVQKETIQIANILLNPNSVHFLNYGDPFRYKDNWKRINKFKANIIEHSLTIDEFIIDTSSVMALYGIRSASDVDFLTDSNDYLILEEEGVENHSESLKYYNYSIYDLLYDPNNYLYYNDLKFITLPRVLEFKENRNEQKDREDAKLIKMSLQDRQKNFKYLLMDTMYSLKRSKRNFTRRSRSKLILVTKKLGIYESLKSIYRSFKE